eukprot:1162024-Pelagomonas_calceolata.AAC.8
MSGTPALGAPFYLKLCAMVAVRALHAIFPPQPSWKFRRFCVLLTSPDVVLRHDKASLTRACISNPNKLAAPCTEGFLLLLAHLKGPASAQAIAVTAAHVLWNLSSDVGVRALMHEHTPSLGKSQETANAFPTDNDKLWDTLERLSIGSDAAPQQHIPYRYIQTTIMLPH